MASLEYNIQARLATIFPKTSANLGRLRFNSLYIQ